MVLIAISGLRVDLMKLERHLRSEETTEPVSLLVEARQRLRVLASFMETKSGAQVPRAEVLDTFSPLPQPTDVFGRSADGRRRARFGHEWDRELDATCRMLSAAEDDQRSSSGDSST